MATFHVFRSADVSTDRGGYSGRPNDGAAPESTHESFDVAYDAAMAAGGDRYVVPILRGGRVGAIEYVPVST